MPNPTQTQVKWYSMTPEAAARQLNVDLAQGLTTAEAQQRLQQYGPNKLSGKQKEPGWQAFLRQYKDFMQILLVATAVVSWLFTRELGTAILLIALTILNAVIGLRQESKAEAGLAALQNMMKSIARVRRDGQTVEIDAEQLAPGDVVLMEAGNRVPADGRLFVTATMEIEEAALTGESVASPKDIEPLGHDEPPLGDRHNMAYMNTSVTRGRGEMLVTATGMDTEMGHIANLLNKTEAGKTSLQKQLDRLVILIAGIAGATFLAMVAIGLSRGEDMGVIFIAGIALAVAAIPTGLPMVVTTLYSTGVRQMASQNAIIKRLPSVETLGSVSAICSDKTGTLTLNQMTAVEFTVPGQNRYRVTGEGYSVKGRLEWDRVAAGQPWQKGATPYTAEGQILSAGGSRLDLEPIMLPMALCADARLDGDTLIGDPTEGALIVLAEKGGVSVDGARELYPRVAEVPFDSDYKFMATFHNMTDAQGRPVVRGFIKGAPDVLIGRGGSFYMPGGENRPITDENRHLAQTENDRMAQAGERVMAVASRDFDPATFNPRGNLIELVNDLTLIAMVGIVDPPRPEVKAAIAECRNAGIQVRMITGDHAVTAAAIGQQLGITGKALTGAQFAAINDDELIRQLPDIGVVARVAPEDKVRLVNLLQRKQHIVAMTGDGVNDAPALKRADIGVAMGVTGTEVSRDAAVMILTDDNFATIVKAIETGRAIYDNLFKYIRFQMATLMGYILTYLGAAIFLIAGGAPFVPLVVLAQNFLVQAPIGIALGLDKPSPGLMNRKPRPPAQPVLSRAQWARIVFLGLMTAIATLILEWRYEPLGPAVAYSVGWAVFSLFALVIGVTSFSETESVFHREIGGDWRQLSLLGISLLFTVLLPELGIFQRIFGLTSLTGDQWLTVIGFAVVFLLIDEVVKAFLRRSRTSVRAS